MANIALLAHDTGYTGNPRIEAALEATGHVVTVLAASTYASIDFGLYDLVLTARVGPNETYTTGLVAQLQSLLDSGTPLGIGLTDFAISSGASGVNSVASLIGLTGLGSMSNGGNVNEITIVNNSADPTSGLTLGNLTIYSVNNFNGAVASMVGTVLANGSGDDPGTTGLPVLGIVEAGTQYNASANTSGARAFMYSALYAGQSDYTVAGKELLNDLVTWALSSAPPVTGTLLLEDSFAGMADGEDLGGRIPDVQNIGTPWIQSDPAGVEGDGAGKIKFSTVLVTPHAQINLGAADMRAEVQFDFGSGSSFSLFARANGEDLREVSGSGYELFVFSFLDEIKIYKRENDVRTQLAASPAGITGVHTWGFEVQGTSLRGYRDGVQVISTTDSDIAAGTFAGVMIINPISDARADNFKGYTLTDATALTGLIGQELALATGAPQVNLGHTVVPPGNRLSLILGGASVPLQGVVQSSVVIRYA